MKYPGINAKGITIEPVIAPIQRNIKNKAYPIISFGKKRKIRLMHTFSIQQLNILKAIVEKKNFITK